MIAGAHGETGRFWTRVAHAYGFTTALIVAVFVAGIPLQVTDNLRGLLEFQQISLGRLLVDNFTKPGFLRPFLWLPPKVLFDISAGHYTFVYKTFHLLQLIALCALFVHILRVRTALDFAAATIACAVLIGVHTFGGTVREEFPVNIYMTVVLCCLAVTALALRERPHWVADAAAVALLVFAALSFETGLLVWVIVAAAYLLGLRGISARGVAAATLALVSYLVVRFTLLGVGTPDLSVRTTGFGFARMDPPQLIDRFGSNPVPFYAYNVAASIASVLFSEPRAGVWHATRASIEGTLPPWQAVHLASSLAVVAMLAMHARTRWATWRRWEFDRFDRLLLLFPIVLVANAVISYPYTKDVIMSPAGALYAVAAFVAVRAVLYRTHENAGIGAQRAAVVAMLAVASVTWTIRAGGLCHILRESAWRTRNEWAYVTPAWLESVGMRPRDERGWALVRQLQHEALTYPVPYPFFAQRWATAVVDPLF